MSVLSHNLSPFSCVQNSCGVWQPLAATEYATPSVQHHTQQVQDMPLYSDVFETQKVNNLLLCFTESYLSLYHNHLHFKGTATGSISHGTPGQASCYHDGTATSAKKWLHMVAVYLPEVKKEGVKVVTANLPESFVNANEVCLL